MKKSIKGAIIFFLLVLGWNIFLDKSGLRGIGFNMSAVSKLESEAINQARNHPNKIVGAYREMIQIPFASMMATFYVMIFNLGFPLMVTFGILQGFKEEATK